jgi:hypothetical protein
VLWGDYYYDAKRRKVVANEPEAGALPLFVRLCLNAIWAVYAADDDSTRLNHIASSLGLLNNNNNNNNNNNSATAAANTSLSDARSLMAAWLPLAEAVLSNVVDEIPSPKVNKGRRVFRCESIQTKPQHVVDGRRVDRSIGRYSVCTSCRSSSERRRCLSTRRSTIPS